MFFDERACQRGAFMTPRRYFREPVYRALCCALRIVAGVALLWGAAYVSVRVHSAAARARADVVCLRRLDDVARDWALLRHHRASVSNPCDSPLLKLLVAR